jgi:hypothetical protein
MPPWIQYHLNHLCSFSFLFSVWQTATSDLVSIRLALFALVVVLVAHDGLSLLLLFELLQANHVRQHYRPFDLPD